MSSGAFVRSKYEADDGTILNIRVQPETISANLGGANAAPSGDVNGLGSAKARGGKREIGVKARRVRVAFTATVPTGYKADTTLEIPILTKALYDGIALGSTGTYLTVPVQVIGKSAESVR